jgi:hypothetical protein
VNITWGPSFRSTTATLLFREPVGSYAYTVGTSDKRYTAPGGSFTVTGTEFTGTVTFARVTYPITFTETGLPAGIEWWVNISHGPSTSSNITTLSFVEPNGTYPFRVGSVPGYRVVPDSGNVTVQGSGPSEALTFAAVPPAPGFLRLPGSDGYLVVAGAIAAVLAIGAIAVIRSKRRKGPPS